VEIEPARDGTVRVTRHDRWFKGNYLLSEQVAHRQFDSSDDGALLASAEFLAELEDPAAHRNRACGGVAEAGGEDTTRTERAAIQ
jgi:hypothetical protein